VAGEDDALDQVLEAVANPHRREILRVLGLQPCAIHQLAQMRALSLPAIHKHLKVLEFAGLITRHKQGRTTYLTLNRRPLAQLQEWVGQFHPYWGADGATHENYLDHLAKQPVSQPAADERKKEN